MSERNWRGLYLSLKKMDRVLVIESDGIWWKVLKIATGEIGFVPSNFLDVLPSPSGQYFLHSVRYLAKKNFDTFDILELINSIHLKK